MAESDTKIQKDDSTALKLGFLLIAGFLLPFLLMFLTAHGDIQNRLFHAMRLGGFGFILALAIFGLGHMDQKLHTTANMDKKSQIVAMLLGMMLWLVWLGTGQIVFIAADETRADESTMR